MRGLIQFLCLVAHAVVLSHDPRDGSTITSKPSAAPPLRSESTEIPDKEVRGRVSDSWDNCITKEIDVGARPFITLGILTDEECEQVHRSPRNSEISDKNDWKEFTAMRGRNWKLCRWSKIF